jgi:hypothetical protein
VGAPPLRGRSRRALLATLAAGAAGGVGSAGCALPWQRTDPRAPLFTPPAQTPVSFGPTRLRLVLAREGHPPLDTAARDALLQVASELRYTLDLSDSHQFADGPEADDIIRQLLIGVQAGYPPDGVLLLGRQAQTARMQSMGLIQEVSGLMRGARTRLGATPEVAERAHFIGGNWLATPLYQRLIGHYVRLDGFARAGLDAEAGTAAWEQLREAVPRAGGWGIGPADTADADAWCWSAIHAWGGALADKAGTRVTLASAETGAALEWLATTFRGAAWPDRTDAEKDAAYANGGAAYTYTEGSTALTAGGALVTGPVGPAGPGFRPRAVGGGAVWVLPRGAQAEAVERLWEALWQPERQRALWRAGGGFALPVFEGQWSDAAVAALPHQESVRRFRTLLAAGGFISDSGQAARPTAASQAVEAGRLAVRMVRAVLGGRAVPDVLAAAQRDAEAIYREHAFPEG